MTDARPADAPQPFRGEDALPLPNEIRVRRKKPRDPAAAFEPSGRFNGWAHNGRGF